MSDYEGVCCRWTQFLRFRLLIRSGNPHGWHQQSTCQQQKSCHQLPADCKKKIPYPPHKNFIQQLQLIIVIIIIIRLHIIIIIIIIIILALTKDEHESGSAEMLCDISSS